MVLTGYLIDKLKLFRVSITSVNEKNTSDETRVKKKKIM